MFKELLRLRIRGKDVIRSYACAGAQLYTSSLLIYKAIYQGFFLLRGRRQILSTLYGYIVRDFFPIVKVAPARWAVSMRGLLGCIEVLL